MRYAIAALALASVSAPAMAVSVPVKFSGEIQDKGDPILGFSGTFEYDRDIIQGAGHYPNIIHDIKVYAGSELYTSGSGDIEYNGQTLLFHLNLADSFIDLAAFTSYFSAGTFGEFHGESAYGNFNNGLGGSGFADLTIYSVPEPATWAMMILGFGVVGAAVRRRRSALAA